MRRFPLFRALALIALTTGCQAESTPQRAASPSPTTEMATSTPSTPIFFISPTPPRKTPLAATPAELTWTLSPASPTPSPTPSASLMPILKRRLDAPIGDYYKFVIHKTRGGERLEDLAAQYGTSAEAILYINYNLTNPTWSAVLVVIPAGFSDVAGLPVFVAYQVTNEDRGISTDKLAEKLRANPFDLKYYNGMTAENERPLVGDWMLVPWARPVPRVRWAPPEDEEKDKKR